ncbi:MAG: DNA methyltransferase, partial [Thaumarchaeota archaeon]|nr:DNA methyltransferase [Nitrososphaerota archaeon]
PIFTIQKTTSFASNKLDSVADYIIWYAKDITLLKYHNLFTKKEYPTNDNYYKFVELTDGTRRLMSTDERFTPNHIPPTARIFRHHKLTSEGKSSKNTEFEFNGTIFTPRYGHWKTSIDGLKILAQKKRIIQIGNGIEYVRYFDDFPYKHLNNVWSDVISGFMKKMYVVQTNPTIIERIMLMSTDPGDLVLDPTCGSGTTAYVAEKYGRRWITCDTSRVAITLAKQRLMTSYFDYYKLQHPNEGISSGFEYETVPHITLGSIANNEEPPTETLYDKPKLDKTKTRISGPFTVEAVPAPTVKSIDELSKSDKPKNNQNLGKSLQQQWRDELLKTGIRGKSGQKIEFSRVETHPATRWIHADAETIGKNPKRVMISFGPEHAPLEQRQVELAIEEAREQALKPAMIIFAAMQFDPEAAKDIDELNWPGITILKAEMNKDLLTKDLKKKRTTNESFWLMGQPDVDLKKNKNEYTINVNGFDYYNISNNKIESGSSSKIAMWMLDTDYDGRSIYPQQVFFPMSGNLGWEKLSKTLRSQIDDTLIEKYSGTKSIPFESGPNKRAAVKIVDDRGIESLKIVELK